MKHVIAKASRAGKFVDTKHVETLKANYKEERWVENSRRIGKQDSLSVWYSIEELEEFISTARSEAGDGVRMYFGTYGEENAPQPLYAGRQTIVMVATKMKEKDGLQVHRDLFIQNGKESNILAYNLGRLCPPFCRDGIDIFQDMKMRVAKRPLAI